MKPMSKSRLEAFTDGVVAIVLTVLVMTIELPNDPSWQAVLDIQNTLIAYVVSFVFVAAMWISHHRLFQAVKVVSGRVLWANIFWLFWLSLCPAVTSWAGRYPTQVIPELCYALIYTMWSISFALLSHSVAKANPDSENLQNFVYNNNRSLWSIIINILSLPLIFIFPPTALIARLLVFALWVIPNFKLRK
jgi:uncharacterized membrane protein